MVAAAQLYSGERVGIRDIINSDYLSGTIRLVDALLVAGCLAVGVTLGYTLLSTVTGVVW